MSTLKRRWLREFSVVWICQKEIHLCRFTFRRYLTDEDGSFLKLSVAIIEIFDSSSIGMSSSFVY